MIKISELQAKQDAVNLWEKMEELYLSKDRELSKHPINILTLKQRAIAVSYPFYDDYIAHCSYCEHCYCDCENCIGVKHGAFGKMGGKIPYHCTNKKSDFNKLIRTTESKHPELFAKRLHEQLVQFKRILNEHGKES